MALLRMTCCLWPGPCRDFVPAADPLSVPPESGQRAAPVPPPTRYAGGFPAMLEARGRAELTALRSVQTGVASQFLKRAAHAPRASALLGGFKGEVQNSRRPKANRAYRADEPCWK